MPKWYSISPFTPSSPRDPLAGDLQPPVPPCSIFERLRLSSSPFFFVPRYGKPLTCGYVAAGAFFVAEKWAPYFWKPLIWGGFIKN